MNRPRILHLRASNFVGGPEHQLLRYIENDRNGPFESHFGVFIGENEGFKFLQALEAKNATTVGIPTDSTGAAFRALTAYVKEHGIQAICAHGYKADILGLWAGKRCHVPVAFFLRGWTGEDFKVRVYESLDRICLRFANRIVCLSNTQATRLAAQSGMARKIRVVPNSIDVPRVSAEDRTIARKELQRRFGLREDGLLIASAGRLSPEKGVEDLLKIVPRLHSTLPRLQILIFGEGPLRKKYLQTINESKLNGRVILAGFQSDLRSLLPGLDLLVNPSRAEEMPNIVLEGMAAGLPVLATRVGGVEEIAGPERAVFLVDPQNPDGLASSICELLNNPDRATALAQAGHKRVAERYSVQQQIQAMHGVYEELVGKRGAEVLPQGEPEPIQQGAPSALRENRSWPMVSVVIPVRNEEAHISTVLGQLEAQDYPRDRLEVLVADGNSTDGTREIVAEYSKAASMAIRCLANPKQRSSAGRNVGARNAKGDFVFFIDGHCVIPDRGLIRTAVRLFERTGADCLSRPQPLLPDRDSAFQRVLADVRATRLGHGTDSTIYNTRYEGPVDPSSAGAMYRKSVFEKIGYYDEHFDACEDVEFNKRVWKAGLKSYTSPGLTVFYRPRGSFSSLWRQMLRYGRGRCRLIRKHPDAFTISQIIPAMFLLWVIGGALASLVSPSMSLLYSGSTVLYLIVVLAYSVSLGWRFGRAHGMLAPLVYPTIHLGLGAGFLSEFIRPARHDAKTAAMGQRSSAEDPQVLGGG
jgi:succinoglycan biosynthesis protein ExoA